MDKTKKDTKTLEDILSECGISPSLDDEYSLILWNDDVTTFEWVIYTLMSILNFSSEKAESTAWNVHLLGKDIIMKGSKDYLEPYKKLLLEKQLIVTIDK